MDHPDPSSSSVSSTPAPDEEQFSQVVSFLLLGLEELKQSLPSTNDDNDNDDEDHGNNNSSSPIVSIDHAVGWHAHLNNLLPALDNLARWTADTANPASVQADLFRMVQQRTQHVALQVLRAMMVALIEPMDDEDEDDPNTEDDHYAHNSLDDRLRAFQGAVAQTTECCLRLLYNPPDLIRAILQVKNDNGGNDSDSHSNNNNTTATNNMTMEQVVQEYVAFQRTTFRLRVKPTIAALIQQRKQGGFDLTTTTNRTNTSSTITASQRNIMATATVYHDDDEDDDNNNNSTNHHQNQNQPQTIIAYEKYHANALANILGQAATLLQPLQQWQQTLPPLPHDNTTQQYNNHHPNTDPVLLSLHQLCRDAMTVLDQQAQQLAQTISTWFWEDRPLDQFLALPEQSATLQNGSHHNSNNSNNHTTTIDTDATSLALLDGMVDEMSLACLLLAQYQNLLQEGAEATISTKNESSNNNNNILQHQLLPEWSFKYAALERTLALLQWRKACSQLAAPIQIVMGSRIYVPSVVEDAIFLSTKALERAASTLHPQAMGTVAVEAVAHLVWSTDDDEDNNNSNNNRDVILGNNDNDEDQGVVSVFRALLEERGCWIDPEEELAQQQLLQEDNDNGNPGNHDNSPNKNNNFTSALLDALDQDLGTTQSDNKGVNKTPPRSGKVPSGNFLSALTGIGTSSSGGVEQMRLMQMQAKFCALNGLHAATGACQSLVEHLDELLVMGEGDEHDEEEEHGDNHSATTSTHNNSNNSNKNDDPAHKMIQLAREELVRYSSVYQSTLQQKVANVISEYCIVADDGHTPLWNGHGLCLDHVTAFIAHETYDIGTAAQLQQLEADERLEAQLMVPLRAYLFLHEMAARSEVTTVLGLLAQELITRLVQVILTTLWKIPKPFTDWGSLLFSKQVRLIQTYFQECVTPPLSSSEALTDADPTAPSTGVMVEPWERLTQVVAILQMEKPAEFLLYTSAQPVLTADEVSQTMKLRVDFAPETIASVVESYSSAASALSTDSQAVTPEA